MRPGNKNSQPFENLCLEEAVLLSSLRVLRRRTAGEHDFLLTVAGRVERFAHLCRPTFLGLLRGQVSRVDICDEIGGTVPHYRTPFRNALANEYRVQHLFECWQEVGIIRLEVSKFFALEVTKARELKALLAEFDLIVLQHPFKEFVRFVRVGRIEFEDAATPPRKG